jgi:hypothetical protein
MKKFISILAILLIIQSCDDKKTQQFGGVNLTIKKQEYSNDSEVQPDIDVDIKLDQEDFELKILKDKEIVKNTNSNLIFNNYRVKTIIEPISDELKIESLQNQIADIDAVRVTLNNDQPTTIPLINGTATYSRDGLAIGVIPIKVDLLGGGLEKYTQTKSISVVANQNAAVSFNSFFVLNQQISITNSSFGNTVVQGDQISFEWTNTHSERPVQISVIQNNENNIIQILESSFVGSAYTLSTENSNPANNIGFKISSNVAANTSSSICCFDLVASAPQANNISSTVNEDSYVTIQLDGSSPGGESVTYSIVSNPSNGSLSSISGPNVTYTPNADYNGSDSFTYRVNNGTQDSNTATVTITINNVNDAPVVENLSTSTSYQQQVSIELSGSDVDGDNLTYFINSNPSNGTIAFTGSNSIIYTPNSGFSGSDSFNYGANDGSLDSNIATVSITVEEDDSIEVTYPNGGQEFVIGQTYTLLWNNSFSNTGVELRKDGNRVLDINGDVGTATSLSWTVPSGLTTGEGYVIRVYDAGPGTEFDESDDDFSILSPGGTFIEQVSIDFTSNNTITTQNVLYSNKNYYLKVSGQGSYSGGNRIDAAYISSNSNWSNPEPWVASSNNDSWMFNDVNIRQSLRPNPDQYNSSHVYYYYFQGNDSTQAFGFKDCNYSSHCYGDNSGGLTVEIYESDNNNTAPTTEDIAITIDENRFSSRFTGITLLGSDVDGDDLTYSIVSDASNGTASISGATLTYEANQDYNGTETITYKANDGTVDSNTSTITITITPVNDTPVVTSNGDNTFWNFTVDGGSGGDLVTLNSSEYYNLSNSGYISYSVDYKLNAEVGENQQIHFFAQGDAPNQGGEFNIRVGNILSSENISGHYIAVSQKAGNSWYQENYEISYDNDKHNIIATFDDVNKVMKIYFDYALVGTISYSGGPNTVGAYDNRLVWYNNGDTDQANFDVYKMSAWDGTLLSESQISLHTFNIDQEVAASNTWNFDDADGSATINDSIGSNNGTVVSGAGGGSDNANLVTLDEDVATDIDLSSYISDVDGDNLTYSVVTDVSNATTSVSGSTVTYTPNANYNGTDSFTFKANDGTTDSATGTVNITVNAVNDAPVTTNQSATTVTNQALDITLTSTDIESDSITYSIVSDVSNGSTSLNGAVVTYTPSSDFSGSDSFTFKANDGTDDSNVSTVTINVNSSSIINVPGDYSNIQDAINNALDGTKIIVASGTYNVNDLNITKDIILKGSGMGSTILDGQGSNRIMTINATGQDTLRIIDMTIKNGNALSSGGYVVGFEGSSTIAKFENIVFENNGGGTGNTLFRGLGPDKTFYVNSVVRNNSAENCAGIGEATVYGCLIYGNTGSNNPNPVRDSQIVSTTITGNSGGFSQNAWTVGGATNSQITNSIIYGNSPRELYYYSNSPYSGVTYSTIKDGYSGTGNISSDPQFNNSSAQNYGLSSSSPALNNGNPSLTDPDGTRIDMGAYLDSNGDVYDDPNSQH